MANFAFSNMAGLGGVGGSIIPPFYADFLRDNLYAQLYFRQLGTKVTIPRGYGDKVKIPRWQTPMHTQNGLMQISAGAGVSAAVTEAVAEGTLINVLAMSAEDITGVVVQFAGARGYTDKTVIVTKANFLEGALETLARESAFRFDRYTRKNISANATLRIAGGGTKVTTGDELFGKNIARIRPFMDAANVPPWEDEHFAAIVNPLTQYDIFRDISATGFVPVSRYNNAMKIYRGEIGAMYGIRFLLSNVIPLYGGTNFGREAAASATNGISGGVTGSNAWVFGPDAFYSIELEDGGIEVIHHPPGSGGSVGDAANQRGSIAVKAWYGVVAAPAADERLMRFAHAIGLHY